MFAAILRQIVQEEGRRIFQEPYRFWAIAEDLAGGQLPEEMDFLLALAESGELSQLGSAYAASNPAERERLVLGVRQRMDGRFPDETVTRFLRAFCQAYGWRLTFKPEKKPEAQGGQAQAPAQEPRRSEPAQRKPEPAQRKHEPAAQPERDRRQDRRRWAVIAVVCLLAAALTGGVVAARLLSPSSRLYQQAKEYAAAGSYLEAVSLYDMLGDYRDAMAQKKAAMYAYVQDHADPGDETTYQYLLELKRQNYQSSDELYDSLFGWRVTVTAINTAPDRDDYSESAIALGETVYVHFQVEGGPPDDEAGLTPQIGLRWADGAEEPLYAYPETRRAGETGWYAIETAGAAAGDMTASIYDGDGALLTKASVELTEGETAGETDNIYLAQYAELLRTRVAENQDTGYPTRFLLTDLDGDGSAELVILSLEGVVYDQYLNMNVDVYTVYQGQVIEAGVMQSVGGGFVYGSSTGALHTGANFGDYVHDEFYQFENGRLGLAHWTSGSLEDGVAVYQVDGENADEETYLNALDEWSQFGNPYYLDYEFAWDVSEDAITLLLESPDYFYAVGWYQGY